MTDNNKAPEYRPEMIPLRQGWNTTWLVSVESSMDPENYHAGWLTVSADARSKEVELGGEEMSPAEARNLATALLQAADHAEHYALVVSSVLSDEEMFVRIDLGEDTPTETYQAVHGWCRKAIARAHHHLSPKADANS